MYVYSECFYSQVRISALYLVAELPWQRDCPSYWALNTTQYTLRFCNDDNKEKRMAATAEPLDGRHYILADYNAEYDST